MIESCDIHLIKKACARLDGIARKTPLELNENLSRMYNARVYLKREDTQSVRSFKLRGAYNKIASLSYAERAKGVVCASAGNHAQGVAYSCNKLHTHGVIFMPTTAPQQKVDRVRAIGGEYVRVELVGETFDDAAAAARTSSGTTDAVMIHPFDDIQVIAGQGTIAAEIDSQLSEPIDYVLVQVGGGGLAAGIGSYFHAVSPATHVIGVEPVGAASMYASFGAGEVVALDTVDTFVDGVAVKRVGDTTFSICKQTLDSVVRVPEGKVCDAMIELYQKDGIVAEPAGALGVAALDLLGSALSGKNVICIVSGGNNDLYRYPEVIRRSGLYRDMRKVACIE